MTAATRSSCNDKMAYVAAKKRRLLHMLFPLCLADTQFHPIEGGEQLRNFILQPLAFIPNVMTLHFRMFLYRLVRSFVETPVAVIIPGSPPKINVSPFDEPDDI